MSVRVDFSGFCGASKAGVALATVTARGAVAVGTEGRASASTVRVKITNPAASKTEQAPATSQIGSVDFELGLLDSRRFTIRPFY
jgi:hypothetical protein